MPSRSYFIHPLTGQRIEYAFYAPAGHWLESNITHKVRERSLREQFLFPALTKSSIMIDVGSAYGSWTIPAAYLAAWVYSVDPRTTVCNILQQSLDANNLHNVTIVNAAASNQVSEAGYEMCDSGNSTTINDEQSHVVCRNHVMVPTVSIDWLVFNQENMPRVDFIKIDAEGVEMDVLEGAKDTIRAFMPNLIIECHLLHNPAMVDQVLAFMDAVAPESYGDVLKWNVGAFSEQRPHLIFKRKTI